jgi:glycolate oxidase
MDRPAIHAVEEFVHAGYPLDVEALLIVELDGPQAEVDDLIGRVEAIAKACRSTLCKVSQSEEERLLFWAGRKAAFPAVGRISPDYYCVDGTIPRGKLPLVLKRMRELSEHYGLRCANVFHAGYPLDVEALLIVELDGPQAEVDDLIGRVETIARACRSTMCKVSQSEEERLLFWAGRKAAFPAVGRISPDYYCVDGTIPRGKLPLVLKRMRELSEHYGLRCANVFHAGDGNLHPLILYDANVPGELDKTERFGADILRLCVEVGGVLTGEHGVGVEKRDLMPVMFSEIDLDAQQRLKCAFDENGLLNPGKVFPQLRRCAELGRMHISGGKLPFPDIPRF